MIGGALCGPMTGDAATAPSPTEWREACGRSGAPGDAPPETRRLRPAWGPPLGIRGSTDGIRAESRRGLVPQEIYEYSVSGCGRAELSWVERRACPRRAGYASPLPRDRGVLDLQNAQSQHPIAVRLGRIFLAAMRVRARKGSVARGFQAPFPLPTNAAKRRGWGPGDPPDRPYRRGRIGIRAPHGHAISRQRGRLPRAVARRCSPTVRSAPGGLEPVGREIHGAGAVGGG